MSASAISLNRAASFYDAQVGQKAVVAVTGIILFGFVLVHMIGNMQVYLPPGPDGTYAIDHYGELLHSKPALLWVARLVLLGCVLLHVTFSVLLWFASKAALPVGYRKKDNSNSSYASRTMILSGPIIAAFVVYHLLHFTTGQAHPDFKFLSVRHNVITGFQQPLASGFYILANILLAIHLSHGLWSMFQSLGINHPRYNALVKNFAALFSTVIAVGNVSIPVAVMAGLIK